MKKLMKGEIHPIVIFWLGVLTGAVLIALVFGYKVLDTMEYQARVLRYTPTVASPMAPDVVPPTTRGTILNAADVMWGTGTGGFKPTDVKDSVSWGTGTGGF